MDDDSALIARWQEAARRFLALEMGRRKVELTSIIRPILADLQASTTLPDLLARYRGGLNWCVDIAKEGYPRTPSLWKLEITADVAFGLRYRQMVPLPGAPD